MCGPLGDRGSHVKSLHWWLSRVYNAVSPSSTKISETSNILFKQCWASLDCFFLYFSCSFTVIAGTHEIHSVFLEGWKLLLFSIFSQPPFTTGFLLTLMAKNASANSWHQKRTGKKQLSVLIFSYDDTFLGTQVKFSHQFLNRYWVGNAKVQLMFPGYWVLRSEISASTSFRQPLVQEWCSQEASLFDFWLKNKTKWNRNKPSLFLDYTIQEKDHSHWIFSFPFLSLQSLHKCK